MRAGLIALVLLLVFPSAAMAQAPNIVPAVPGQKAAGDAGEIVPEPLCFAVRNEASYTIYGSFVTDLYTDADGSQARHRSNFRLESVGSKDDDGNAVDRAEFCSYGPFFAGRKLEMTLRTLVPIFSCQTRIDQGEIVIHGKRKPDGGTDTTASCFE